MKTLNGTGTVLLGLLALLLAGPGKPAAAEKAGDVVAVRGKAVIERTTGRLDARVRDALQESDSIATRDKARVKMLFRDDSVLTLGANSRLNVKKYLYSPESKRAESIYELADGRLRAVVGSPGFKVVTPTAYAAARGTVFTVAFDGETGATTITVIEGSVEVRNVNAEIAGVQVVNAGQSTSVAFNLPPTVPQTAQPAGQDAGSDGGVTITTAEEGGGGGAGLLGDLASMTDGGLSQTPPIEQNPATNRSNVSVNITFPR